MKKKSPTSIWLIAIICCFLSFFNNPIEANCLAPSNAINYFSKDSKIVTLSTAIFAQDSIVPTKKTVAKVKKDRKYDQDAVTGFILVVAGHIVLPVVTWIFGIKKCVNALSTLRTSKKKGRKLAIAGIIIGVIYLTSFAMLLSAFLI
jgi:hypothetical protein